MSPGVVKSGGRLFSDKKETCTLEWPETERPLEAEVKVTASHPAENQEVSSASPGRLPTATAAQPQSPALHHTASDFDS